ncbi:hypothetical protein NCCP28_01670 [Niallia sp. NCCP-28]|nr:hypothetical protein NCCP28_01670 [Niallia sp. NCCP-28]
MRSNINDQDYKQSALKDFLNGEPEKISKRKVDRHPKLENVQTKIGHFIVEAGHDATSNSNYNFF